MDRKRRAGRRARGGRGAYGAAPGFRFEARPPAPAVMLSPLVLRIFPSIILIIIGPAAIRVVRG